VYNEVHGVGDAVCGWADGMKSIDEGRLARLTVGPKKWILNRLKPFFKNLKKSGYS
jgi:hypothetical protein